MPEPVARIRYAVERGEYTRAAALWRELAASLASQITDGTLDREDWARTSEAYRWCRNLLLAERAHLLAGLNAAHAARAYVPHTTTTPASFVQGSF